jgi:hypothetical protein
MVLSWLMVHSALARRLTRDIRTLVDHFIYQGLHCAPRRHAVSGQPNARSGMIRMKNLGMNGWQGPGPLALLVKP